MEVWQVHVNIFVTTGEGAQRVLREGLLSVKVLYRILYQLQFFNNKHVVGLGISKDYNGENV